MTGARPLLLVVLLASIVPATPASAEPGRPSVLAQVRRVWQTGREVHRLHALPMSPAADARLEVARAAYRQARADVVAAVKSSAPMQILRGIAAGPKDTWRTIRQHPFKVVAAVAAIAAASAALEVLSLPAQPIMLGGCGLLTLRALRQGYPEVKDAFRRKAPDRFKLLGENLFFPAVAYSVATAFTLSVGDIVESLGGSHAAAAGSKGVGYAFHIVDDIPSIAAGLSGSARR